MAADWALLSMNDVCAVHVWFHVLVSQLEEEERISEQLWNDAQAKKRRGVGASQRSSQRSQR